MSLFFLGLLAMWVVLHVFFVSGFVLGHALVGFFFLFFGFM